MLDRTRIINSLIDKNGYKSYLEIGVGDGANLVNVECVSKHAIDPSITPHQFAHMRAAHKYAQVTSDEFFEKNDQTYDLIFIDGLHESEQVERDILNGYAALNKGGMLLIHDCMPWEEIITRVPRETFAWTGDVYRAVCGFISEYGKKIKCGYIEERAGLFWIQKTGNHKMKAGFNMKELTYEDFDKIWKPLIKAL